MWFGERSDCEGDRGGRLLDVSQEAAEGKIIYAAYLRSAHSSSRQLRRSLADD